LPNKDGLLGCNLVSLRVISVSLRINLVSLPILSHALYTTAIAHCSSHPFSWKCTFSPRFILKVTSQLSVHTTAHTITTRLLHPPTLLECTSAN